MQNENFMSASANDDLCFHITIISLAVLLVFSLCATIFCFILEWDNGRENENKKD